MSTASSLATKSHATSSSVTSYISVRCANLQDLSFEECYIGIKDFTFCICEILRNINRSIRNCKNILCLFLFFNFHVLAIAFVSALCSLIRSEPIQRKCFGLPKTFVALSLLKHACRLSVLLPSLFKSFLHCTFNAPSMHSGVFF